MRFTIGTALSGILGLSLLNAAHADIPTMNYGDLQSLFGEAVTASATGTPQRASEAPVNMTIITADEIRQAGTRNLAAVMARVPGLDILQTGINSFDIGVRGYQQPFQPRLLVLLDGRQVFIDDYSRTIWDAIPVNIDDIRQIEIVKGAASAMFGSNAAGGVINIVTNSPLYDQSDSLTLSGGTQSNFAADGTWTFNGAWGGNKLSAGVMDEHEYGSSRIFNATLGYPCCDQYRPQVPYHSYVNDSAVFVVTPKFKINTEFTYDRSGTNTGDPTDAFIEGGQRTQFYSARAGWSWNSNLGLITNDNYFNRSVVGLYEPTDGGQPYKFDTSILVSQLADQFQWGADDIFRAELEYRYKTFHFGGQQTQPITPALAENNLAAAGTWVHHINGQLTSTIAARFDQLQISETGTLPPGWFYSVADYSHVDNAWSGNADLVWAIDGNNSLKGGFGRGIQMPSFMQTQYGEATFYISQYQEFPGNPRLHPTIVEDLSVEYTHKFASLATDLTLSPFYELNQSIVAPFVPSGNFNVFGQSYLIQPSANIGNSKALGGEIQAKGTQGAWRWDLSYSYSHVIDGPYFTAGNVISFDHSAPEHHVRAWLGYSAGKWEIDANLQYLTGLNALRSFDGGNTAQFTATPAYVTFGGRIAYEITGGLVLALSGTDLQGQRQVTSPFPAVMREIRAALTKSF